MERFSEVDKLSQTILEQVARLALQNKLKEEVDLLPYVLVSQEQPVNRCCVYHERAVVADRIRLAMGLNRRKGLPYQRLSEAVDQALALERLEEPVIAVIDSACEACPSDRFMVTDACRNCMAHPCVNVCPKQAIVIANQRAYIDQDSCIECGKCAQVCPFHAIAEVIRPCVRVCEVGAIQGTRGRKTIIDHRKCLACGHCVRACPFGAVAEKSEIVQVIELLKKAEPVYAIVAPSFVGQFGREVSFEALRTAFRGLGFADMVEVALGADLVTYEEAEDFIKLVPDQQPFAINSCCTAFRFLVEKHHPKIKNYLFKSASPMVVTGEFIKERDPLAKVVFVGPCMSKKLESLQAGAREMIDRVLTFEEMAAIFRAADVDLTQVQELPEKWESSRTGRLFARTGGMTEALISTIKKLQPDKNVQPVLAEGMGNCEKLLRNADRGRLNGNLIEGMACVGGCVGGPGALLKNVVATKLVNDYSQKSPYFYSLDNPHLKEPVEGKKA